MTAPRMATDAFELLDGISTSRFGWRKVRGDANLAGFSAAATPGFVAGLALALGDSGTLSPGDVLAPAIQMADTGVETPWTTTLRISASLRAFAAYPDSMATFAPKGVPLNPGGAHSKPDLLVQPALARTLRTLAGEGPETFYRGSIAAQIDRGMRDNGGLVTAEDLAAYQPQVHEAVAGIPFADSEVFAVPGSNGGFTALETLGALHAAPLARLQADRIERLATIATAARRSFARRRAWSRTRTDDAAARAQSTTHVVAVDRDRMAVSMTATLADNFGSGATLPGTGIVLNNALQWFNPEPGTPVSLMPGGHGLNNMTPLLVRRGGVPVLAVGSAGGIRIIDAVTQIVVNSALRGMALDAALAEPRIDASGDAILADSRLPLAVVQGLRRRGFDVDVVIESPHAHQFSRPIAAAIEYERILLDRRRGSVTAGCRSRLRRRKSKRGPDSPAPSAAPARSWPASRRSGRRTGRPACGAQR